MTPRQIYILDKLGIDTNQTNEDILSNLIELSEWLYDELEKEEESRFAKELKRLTQTKTN